jgi:colanic acid biosynthesis glycosyl transferase WcaI
MRLLLLNQYGPGSGAPTGRILGELAEGLQQLGHVVTLLEVDAAYGKSRRGLRRIVHEMNAHALLACRSARQRQVDAVLSLTSPACLAVTGAFVARLLRARHFHWAMDLYPEAGIRLGELREGALTRFLAGQMRRAYRKAERVVVLDEDMREHLRRAYGVESAILEPFPPEVAWVAPERARGEPKRWLYSGNLGRAHEIDVLLEVQKRLEAGGNGAELVLQGRGAQFGASQEAARELGLRQVQWRPPAPDETLGQSLLAADVLVVTRKPAMKGLLLPSKLMLAELSGRPILWIGDTDGFTAARLRKAGHGVFASDEIEPIAAWLRRTLDPNAEPPAPPRASGLMREEVIAAWNVLLRES